MRVVLSQRNRFQLWQHLGHAVNLHYKFKIHAPFVCRVHCTADRLSSAPPSLLRGLRRYRPCGFSERTMCSIYKLVIDYMTLYAGILLTEVRSLLILFHLHLVFCKHNTKSNL